VASLSPTSTPYRKSAAPVPRTPAQWPRRLARALGASTLLGAAAFVAWYALPWKVHAELRPPREALPPHERIHAVWWSDWGWALAAGEKGQVFVRADDQGADAPARWSPLATSTHSDLLAVAGGPFDPGWWPGADEYAIVVGDGAVVACTPTSCETLADGIPARAVAYAGGEALFVGDGGTVGTVVPWYTNMNVYMAQGSGVVAQDKTHFELRDQGIHDLTDDFRAVDVSCDDAAERCEASVWSAERLVLRGVRTGKCDNGTRGSGSVSFWCHWAWSLVPAPSARPPDSELSAWTTVDVVSTKVLGWKREHTRALVTFGSPTQARIGRELLPLESDRRFVAAYTPFKGLGDVTILADEAGDVYVAR
jgi:hypothetical protein